MEEKNKDNECPKCQGFGWLLESFPGVMPTCPDCAGTGEQMTVEEAIQHIEALYPADSQYEDTRSIGVDILESVATFAEIDEAGDWRKLPDSVLIQYAKRCIQEDLKTTLDMGKRFFQILDQLNQKDEQDGTDSVRVCPTMIAADYNHKNGTIVKMGVPGNVVCELLDDSVVPMLILIRRKDYDNLK